MKSFDDYFNENLEGGLSSPSKYMLRHTFEAGAQSRQSEVDELKKQLTLVLDAYYSTNYFESEICINAEEMLGIKDRLSDSWYLKNVKGESHES